MVHWQYAEFTASGLDHVNEAYGEAENPYRVAGPCTVDNFGRVEIDWTAESGPLIVIKAIALEGSVVFKDQVQLQEGVKK
jgi:hypothetical protein